MADPATLPIPQLLELRAALFAAIREFFGKRDFVEVDTPTIVPSPGLDVHLAAFEVRDPGGESAGWLATSPEYQMKRLLSAGARRIFQLCRSYRGEERGRHHEREFTMLEWYRAGAASDEVIHDTEELVAHCAEAIVPEGDNLLFARRDSAPPDTDRFPFSSPWERLTVETALQRHAGASLGSVMRDEDRFYRLWAEEVQPNLGAHRPVVVTDWPESMASLARIQDNGMADRFEAFYRGVELCNGFGELTDAKEQRRRFERDQAQRRAIGAAVYPIDERFIGDLERGMPESAGNALGVDRLLMLLLGAGSIQAVMPFPVERL